MSYNMFFSQLKSFCNEVDYDVRKLRSMVDEKSSAKPVIKNDFSCIDAVEDRFKSLDNRISFLEQGLLGRRENRLSHVKLEEVLERCCAVFESNEQAIQNIQLHLQHHGVNIEPKRRVNILDELLKMDSTVTPVIPVSEPTNESHKENINSSNFNYNSPSHGNKIYLNDESNTSTKQQQETTPNHSFHVTTNSPTRLQLTSSLSTEDLPSTPTLPHWKLSDATRSILGGCHIPTSPSSASRAVTDDHPGSPMSPSTGATTTTHPGRGSSREKRGVTVSVSGSRGREPDTPTTPELTIDLQTCTLRDLHSSNNITTNTNINVNNDYDYNGSHRHDNNNTSTFSPNSHCHTPLTPCQRETTVWNLSCSMTMSPDLPSPPLTFPCSPPKYARMLQPRGVPGSRGGDGWIPLIEGEEWTKVPTFLKIQVSMEQLNDAIQSLNDHIANKTSSATSSTDPNTPSTDPTTPSRAPRLHSFTHEELVTLLGQQEVNTSSSVSLKVTVLGLVHLKRLDISSENGIKVVKVRRFY